MTESSSSEDCIEDSMQSDNQISEQVNNQSLDRSTAEQTEGSIKILIKTIGEWQF